MLELTKINQNGRKVAALVAAHTQPGFQNAATHNRSKLIIFGANFHDNWSWPLAHGFVGFRSLVTESLLSPDHHWFPLVVSSGVWWSLLVSIGVNWCPLVLWWHKQRWRQAAHNAYCVTIVPQLIHLPEFVGRVFVRWRRPLCAEASRQIDRNGSSYHCCCPPNVEMESANAKYEIVQLMSESKLKKY